MEVGFNQFDAWDIGVMQDNGGRLDELRSTPTHFSATFHGRLAISYCRREQPHFARTAGRRAA